jgi:hypothetical protein
MNKMKSTKRYQHNGQPRACSITLTSVVNDYDISSTLEDYEQDAEH